MTLPHWEYRALMKSPMLPMVPALASSIADKAELTSVSSVNEKEEALLVSQPPWLANIHTISFVSLQNIKCLELIPGLFPIVALSHLPMNYAYECHKVLKESSCLSTYATPYKM